MENKKVTQCDEQVNATNNWLEFNLSIYEKNQHCEFSEVGTIFLLVQK